MPKSKFIPVIIFSLAILGIFTVFAFANPIKDEHRNCQQDTDCKIVELSCAAIYYTQCGEKEKLDAVNKSFTEQFQYLSKCTSYETSKLSTRGACPDLEIKAICKSNICSIQK